MMTKEEYFELLQQHDWFYEMSDDYSAYSRGRIERQTIVSLSLTEPDFKLMYNAWLEWYNGCYRGEQPDQPTL